MTAIIDDLFRFNSWAHDRLLDLCEGLSDQQFDEPREIGFGSLRNTLFHNLAVEEIWLDRWLSAPWRAFPTDAGGVPLDEMRRRFREVDRARREWIERERADGWRRMCEFEDSQRNAYRMELAGLLLHVANHGIHHRAQALYFLKQFGKTVPGGLDYIFFRFAHPAVPQTEETIAAMRQFGLEVGTAPSAPVDWNAVWVGNYFQYGDWCNDRLLSVVEKLDAESLDRPMGMGMDTIRKTVLHIADAEQWWLKNWLVGPSAYEKTPPTTSLAELRASWGGIIRARQEFLQGLDGDQAQRIVTASVGPMTIRVPVVESMLQLCGHGTHHRAQLINMLRRLGITAPGCDYTVWLRR